MYGVEHRPSQTQSQWERAGGWLTPDRYVEVALDKAVREKGGSLTREEKRTVAHDARVYLQTNPFWRLLAIGAVYRIVDYRGSLFRHDSRSNSVWRDRCG